MNQHVRGPLRPADDDVVVGTTPATFAARLLELADDARRLRVHAMNNSNASVMLRAMSAESQALQQLMTHLGVDEEAVIGVLSSVEHLQTAVLAVVHEHPEAADVIAAVFDRVGDTDSAAAVREVAGRPAPTGDHLTLVPR